MTESVETDLRNTVIFKVVSRSKIINVDLVVVLHHNDAGTCVSSTFSCIRERLAQGVVVRQRVFSRLRIWGGISTRD